MNMQSEQINELAEALSKAQGAIEGAVKDAKNPFFKSNYADLHSVIACAKAPLSDNGLAVIQTTGMIDAQLCLVTTLAHKSGQWIKAVMPVLLQKQDAQSMGSALTYLRRYSYQAICGISAMDDDGNAASEPKREVSANAQAKLSKAAVSKPPEAPPINDLIAGLAKVDTHISHEHLGEFVSFMSQKHQTTAENIIRSALANAEQLDRFNKALLKHQEASTESPESEVV